MYLPEFKFLVDVAKKESTIQVMDKYEFGDNDVTYIKGTKFIKFKINNYSLHQLAYFCGGLGKAGIEFDIV